MLALLVTTCAHWNNFSRLSFVWILQAYRFIGKILRQIHTLTVLRHDVLDIVWVRHLVHHLSSHRTWVPFLIEWIISRVWTLLRDQLANVWRSIPLVSAALKFSESKRHVLLLVHVRFSAERRQSSVMFTSLCKVEACPRWLVDFLDLLLKVTCFQSIGTVMLRVFHWDTFRDLATWIRILHLLGQKPLSNLLSTRWSKSCSSFFDKSLLG